MFLNWFLLGMAAAAGFGQEMPQLRSTTPDRETETLFCQRWVKHANRVDAFVKLEVDRSHQELKRELLLRTPEYWVKWSFPDEVFDLGLSPHEFGPVSTEIPIQTKFPVTIFISFEEKVVLMRNLLRSNATSTYFYPGSKRLEFKPGVAVQAREAEVPSPFGISRIDVVVRSAQGLEVTRKTLPVPDWARLKQELVEAFEAVEAERRRSECRAHVIVEES